MVFVRGQIMPQFRWFRVSGLRGIRWWFAPEARSSAAPNTNSTEALLRHEGTEEKKAPNHANTHIESPEGEHPLPPTPAKQRLVVIGNGMVSQHFCECLRDNALLDQYDVTVFGEESEPAYDRVQLGKAFQIQDTNVLLLEPREWYAKHGIHLHTDTRAVRIDRDEDFVETARGDRFPFDKLVLATGSSAIVPKGLVVEGQHVQVYRTLQDVKRIRERAINARARELPILVVGGGLLGLELTECLNELGLEVVVIESSEHLLPRQLDETTAEFVAQVWRHESTRLHLGARLSSLTNEGEDVVAELSDETTIRAAFCVVAAGVRPRDELARTAGLACDLFGGVEVNDRLETSDPRIFAIGECARHQGRTYGLVAPGYDMAKVLVARLKGSDENFTGAPLATKLKSSRVKLSVFGQSAENNPLTAPLVVQNDQGLRRIVVNGERITAATLVGEWDESPALQQAIARNLRFTERQQRRFLEGRRVWSNAVVNLRTWPDEAIVCACTGVTCKTLKAACARGCRTTLDLQQKTGAGTVCGSCKPLMASLVDGPGVIAQAVKVPLLVAAALGLLGTLVMLLAPPVPLLETVQTSVRYDVLWRDSFVKQVSGYSLLFLFTVTGLGFSLRKRWKRVQVGTFDVWRFSHVVLGVVCLVGAFVHTGFRLGVNLDLVLMSLFLVASLFGALAGAAVALEGTLSARYATLLRRFWTRAHIYVLWPIPVLILFHVLKVYYF